MYQNSNHNILSFLKEVDFASLLDGASKTLNVIHQAIPVYYQVKPIFTNLGTLNKIHRALEDNSSSQEEKSSTLFYMKKKS